MAQALGHRHRRDVYNTFLATPFTLDGQILDLRCWEQPKHRMLAAYRAKKAPLVGLGFFLFRLILQFFSPRFPFPRQRKDQIKNPCRYRIKRYMAQALRRRHIQKTIPTSAAFFLCKARRLRSDYSYETTIDLSTFI